MKFPSCKKNIIVPSLLSADFSCLKKQVMDVEKYSGWIQLDVMDGHFVPNLSFGPHIAKCLRKMTYLPLDVHLMVEEPEKFVKPFVDSGADLITVHFESKNFMKAIEKIKSYKKKAGIAIRPKTPVEKVYKYFKEVDLVLVMTVEPGFGGQDFLFDMLEKIKKTRDYINRNNLNLYLQIDGGVNENTIEYAKNSGANVFVIGSALFSHKNPQYIKKLLKIIE